MNDLTFGYALCGSFCTFSKSLKQMRFLAEKGYHLLPVMSYNAAKTDTRFGKAADFVQELHDISGRDVIQTIVEAEPIGPKKMVDLMIVAPCTGNTLAKLANGITDTPVTMAVKSNLRIGRPVLELELAHRVLVHLVEQLVQVLLELLDGVGVGGVEG